MAHKAPGKHFRQGMTLIEAMGMFPDDAAAEAWFVKVRWPTGPACPYCGSVNVLSGAKHKTMPYRCREKECRKRFSVRTGTVMQASNIAYQKWALAVYLFMTSLKSVSSMKLHRDLGVTQKSAWHLAHRLRKAFESESGLFAGPVEVDETYMGGKRKNMPKSKREELTGRGVVGKTAVVGAKDRTTNQVRARAVESTNKATIHGFVADHTARTPWSTLTMRWSTKPFQIHTRPSTTALWSMFVAMCIPTTWRASGRCSSALIRGPSTR